MKSIIMLGIICAVIFAVPDGLFGQMKKYDLKSGIVTFENTTTMGETNFTEKSMVYFDEYGMKECRETYRGDELSEVFLSDGKTLYLLKPSGKKAYKQGDAYRGTEMRFDWNEISKRDKTSGKAKKLPNITVAGKNCESYEFTVSGRSVFAGWKKICLFTDITTSGMNVVMKAVKIEENAKVPPEKFKVPAGYSVQ